MKDYKEFLEQKVIKADPVGFTAQNINPMAFEFQKDVIKALCTFGRGACFLGTGLGKTLIQLNVASEILANKSDKVLILAPLSVAEQTVREGAKFGYQVNICESQADVKPGINISNYQKLHKFDSKFEGFVLDESSIIKADGSKTFEMVNQFGKGIPYKLASTASAAPNDYVEFGNHAEFLGIMSKQEMLATFFQHDGGSTQKWELAGWGREAFWKWLCSWSIVLKQPSDLGYDNGKFELPGLETIHHLVDGKFEAREGELVSMVSSLQDRRKARKLSLKERCERAYEIVQESPDEQFVIWCELDDEQRELEKLFNNFAVSIWGKTPDKKKVDMEYYWRTGGCQVLISKPKIFGWGLNWQHCRNVIFVGIDDSWEKLYQATNRCYRFGQEQTVFRHLIYSHAERIVWDNIERKQQQAEEFWREMSKWTTQFSSVHSSTFRQQEAYKPSVDMQLPSFLVA